MKNQIIIKSLMLLNFKGQKSLQIDFDQQTDIFGANGTGKTTISDAFSWLLFGKDSFDRKDFEIKTVDKITGKVIEKIEHEVAAVLLINGEEVSLRRILKEKWQTKKGFSEQEFTGNVTDFYWNDVPVLLNVFNKKVSEILEEQVFKMITSPTYFNSSLKWQDRRSLLTQLAGGELSDAELASGNENYENLVAKLTQGKTLQDYKAQVKASVTKAKDDLKAIPTRYDEVLRTKPEAEDFEALQTELNAKNVVLEGIETNLTSASSALQTKLDGQRTLKLSENKVKSEIEIIEQNAMSQAKNNLKTDTSELDNLNTQLGEKKALLQEYETGMTTLKGKQDAHKSKINSLVGQMDQKRADWEAENAKQFSFEGNDTCCPTCKRDFEASDIEAKKAELQTNFNNQKATKLTQISTDGKSLKTEKENIEVELQGVENRITNGQAAIDKVKEEIQDLTESIGKINQPATTVTEADITAAYDKILSENAEYKAKKGELATIQSQIVEVPEVDNSELLGQKKTVQLEIDEIKIKLQKKAQIEAVETRISQLKEDEERLTAQVNDVEKILFTIESFEKFKTDRIEHLVNSKFKIVQFRMFEEQVNGGLNPTCEAMVNGVPISDVNTASRINAGLDIINALCEHFNVTAPIFIDNRESVTELIETESQIISLIVSPTHKKLEVKVAEMVA